MARPEMNQRRKPETYRLRQKREQQYCRNDVCRGEAGLMLETERAIKPLLTREPCDRGESDKHARDGNAEHFDHVALFVVANFMRKNGFHFRLGELRDQCIEQNDFSKTCEPGEEGVGMA